MPVMISPSGKLGEIPDAEVDNAISAGFRVMTSADRQRMHNRLFLAQKFFEQKHPKVTSMRLPRGRGKW